MSDLPTPVRRDERICFGIAWFATEAEAEAYAAHVREQGITYNGGYMHGIGCGRAPSHDRDGLFAVTD